MTPDLQAFEADWLSTAEASVTLGEPRKLGISFFFEAAEEFEEFLARVPGADPVAEWERRLRDRLDVCARRWVKLHYLDERCDRVSHYLQIDPRIGYPIASLRLYLRLLGRTPSAALESVLEPALEREDTAWGLVLKHADQEPTPRISFRVPRQTAAEVLRRLAAAGEVNPQAASQHGAALRTVAGTDRVFVTFEPGRLDGSSLDFEQVPRSGLPDAVDVAPGLDAFPYVKHRAVGSEPQWTVYVPLKSADPGIARHARVDTPADQGSRT